FLKFRADGKCGSVLECSTATTPCSLNLGHGATRNVTASINAKSLRGETINDSVSRCRLPKDARAQTPRYSYQPNRIGARLQMSSSIMCTKARAEFFTERKTSPTNTAKFFPVST